MPDLPKLAVMPPVLIALFFAASVDQYLFEAFGLLPLYWQVPALGYLLVHIGLRFLLHPETWSSFTGPQLTIVALVATYLMWTAISFVYAPANAEVVELLITRIKAGIFLLVFVVVFIDRDTRTAFAFGAAGLVFVGTVLNVQDFIEPTYSAVPGRAAGFYINPNESGMMLVLLGLVASTRLPVVGNYLVWGLAGLGALLTFSRGSWVFLIIAIAGLAISGRLGGGRGRFVFLGMVALIFAGIFSAYLSGELYYWVVRSPLNEFLDPNTLARLGSQGTSLDDYSSYEREDVMSLGISLFLDSPFLGWGVGSTFVWVERSSTHNMLVMLAAELGILGPVLYLSLFAILIGYTRGLNRLLAISLFGFGIFTHNQLDMTTNIIIFAFAIASLASDVPQRDRKTIPS